MQIRWNYEFSRSFKWYSIICWVIVHTLSNYRGRFCLPLQIEYESSKTCYIKEYFYDECYQICIYVQIISYHLNQGYSFLQLDVSNSISDVPRFIKHKRETCNMLNVFYLECEACLCQTKWDTLWPAIMMLWAFI